MSVVGTRITLAEAVAGGSAVADGRAGILDGREQAVSATPSAASVMKKRAVVRAVLRLE
jgi:hypothetical protein